MIVSIPIDKDLPIKGILCHDAKIMFKPVSPVEFGVEIANSNGYACVAMILTDRVICYAPCKINPIIEYLKTEKVIS